MKQYNAEVEHIDQKEQTDSDSINMVLGYNYVSPELKGYTKIKLSKAQHNDLFPARKRKWHDKCDYYIKDDAFKIEWTSSLMLQVVLTLVLPFVCIIDLLHIDQTLKEYKEQFNQKKTGKFTTDNFFKDQSIIEKIKKISGYTNLKTQGSSSGGVSSSPSDDVTKLDVLNVVNYMDGLSPLDNSERTHKF